MARNITLSLPDELIRRAKIVAAERDTSISAMVASILRQFVGDADDYEQMWEREEAAMAVGVLEIGSVDWSRDDVHAR
jgi:plasmid stability protein